MKEMRPHWFIITKEDNRTVAICDSEKDAMNIKTYYDEYLNEKVDVLISIY